MTSQIPLTTNPELKNSVKPRAGSQKVPRKKKKEKARKKQY
jgi:hypothetical protein